MQVMIGPLARSGLESRGGKDLNASVRAALLYYMQKLRNGRPPTKYPKFLATVGASASDADVSVEVEVDRRFQAEFAREADEQGVSVSELARHAVLLYLADVDLVESRSGRQAAE